MYFLAQTEQHWPLKAPLGWHLCPLDKLSSLFEYFHIWGITRCPRLTLYSACPQPERSLLQDVWAPHIGEYCLETKVWVLSVLAAHGVPLFLILLSQ